MSSLFCCALLCVHSSFTKILKRKRELVALLLMSYRCVVTIKAMWLFLTVPWVGLLCLIVAIPDHTHFFTWINHVDKINKINKRGPSKDHFCEV